MPTLSTSLPFRFRAPCFAAASGFALLASGAAVAQPAPGVFAYKWNASVPVDMVKADKSIGWRWR